MFKIYTCWLKSYRINEILRVVVSVVDVEVLIVVFVVVVVVVFAALVLVNNSTIIEAIPIPRRSPAKTDKIIHRHEQEQQW